MRHRLALALTLLVLVPVASALAQPGAWSADLDRLLVKYAQPEGVRYAAWKADAADLAALEAITEKIAAENPATLPRDAHLAFLLNAYNAWMLRIALEAYPLKSVREIGTLPFAVFTGKRIRLNGERISLNHLEKELIIKGFREPRIHAAINCASRSCPPLAPYAFTAANLEEKLEEVTRGWVTNNPLGVRVDPSTRTVFASAIFDWYADDFKPAGGTLAFINRYRKDNPIPADFKVRFQDYDWALNEVK